MMDCQHARRAIWTDDESTYRAHLADCEDCRAEFRRAGDLRMALAGLRDVDEQPPAWLEPALMSLAGRSRVSAIARHPWVWRGAAVIATAAATAVGVVALARRGRSPLAPEAALEAA